MDPAEMVETTMDEEEDDDESGDESNGLAHRIKIVQRLNPAIFQVDSIKSETLDTQEEDESSEITCPYCLIELESEDALEEHLDECPRLSNDTQQNLLNNNNNEDGASSPRRSRSSGHKSSEGEQSFEVKSVLSFHHPGSNTLAASQFGCPICHKKFKFKSQLKRHVKIHTGERPHSCDVCGATFASKWHVSRHQLTHVAEPEPQVFFCDLCLTAFTKKKNYEIHLLLHSRQKPFKCGECPACFKLKEELFQHMNLHSRRKNVTTTVASTALPQLSPEDAEEEAPPPKMKPLIPKPSIQGTPPLPKLVPMPQIRQQQLSNNANNDKPPHQPIMHQKPAAPILLTSVTSQQPKPPPPPPVITNSVPAKTIPISVLQPSRFPFKPELFMKRDTGSKNSYRCDVCDHTFTRNHHLQRHKLIHTGERPHKCEQCDKAFARKERLNAHIHSAHSGNNNNTSQDSSSWLGHLGTEQQRQVQQFMLRSDLYTGSSGSDPEPDPILLIPKVEVIMNTADKIVGL